MTKNERIASLEERLAAAERRIASLEARPGSWPYQPYNPWPTPSWPWYGTSTSGGTTNFEPLCDESGAYVRPKNDG